MEVVNDAWNTPMTHVEPCHVLFHKLSHTGRALSTWSRRLFSNTKVMVHVALLLILHFELAQEIEGYPPTREILEQGSKQRSSRLLSSSGQGKNKAPALPTLRRETQIPSFFI
jgi:hypothetical protein